MNKNQNIAMGISLAVVAIMVGSAEIFGEKEIIFPEITAVAMGALIRLCNLGTPLEHGFLRR